MARTPLAQVLQDITRRDFLKVAGAATAAATLPVSRAQAADGPSIAIVGAGLAGLSAAYTLKRAGYASTVYEANPGRIGGRCWTGRGAFAEGQLYEHGGELIDQSHTAIRQLCQGLGLRLDNLLQAEANGTDPSGYFDGAAYSWTEATNDLKGIWQQIHSDVSAASYPTLYDLSTERGRELDRMSIAQWIDTYVPGGRSSKLGQLLDVAYNIEYGAECTEQSSLNMLYLIGYSGQGNLRIFGPSNEKLHVVGGNDQITDRMASALGAGAIELGKQLVAVRRTSSGAYTLSFADGTSTTAQKVVMAIPFSILRSSVDLTKAGFKPLKLTAIRNQGMGTNSKLHLQFTDRHWSGLGSNGETFSDRGYQNTWDVTRAQPGTSGILVDYTGGKIGASFGTGTPQERARTFLTQLEPAMPGISKKWNGRATVDFWPGDPYTKGSYSYWKVGQYTQFAGVEREREGNCHFAGEQTSVDFQGYLNGAVETGQRAAAEILADFKRA